MYVYVYNVGPTCSYYQVSIGLDAIKIGICLHPISAKRTGPDRTRPNQTKKSQTWLSRHMPRPQHQRLAEKAVTE